MIAYFHTALDNPYSSSTAATSVCGVSFCKRFLVCIHQFFNVPSVGGVGGARASEDKNDGRGQGFDLRGVFPDDDLAAMVCRWCGKTAVDVNFARRDRKGPSNNECGNDRNMIRATYRGTAEQKVCLTEIFSYGLGRAFTRGGRRRSQPPDHHDTCPREDWCQLSISLSMF